MYVRVWETLDKVLARLVAAGLLREQAMEQIAAAVADGAIPVRVKVDRTDTDIPNKFMSGREVKAPERLQPDQLDWNRSVPREPWETGPWGPAAYAAISWGWRPRRIALLELRTDDVIRVFCRATENDSVPLKAAEAAPGDGAALAAEPPAAEKGADAAPAYHSGMQGRPNSKTLVAEELKRRRDAEQTHVTLKAESEALAEWLKQKHPQAPSAGAGAIRNSFRNELNEAVREAKGRAKRMK